MLFLLVLLAAALGFGLQWFLFDTVYRFFSGMINIAVIILSFVFYKGNPSIGLFMMIMGLFLTAGSLLAFFLKWINGRKK